jgi:hypothetical protein
MTRVAALGSLGAAVVLIASCSGSDTSASTSAGTTRARAAQPQSPADTSHPIAPQPRTFTSKAYGYTLTVPAGWTSRQAFAKWDGESELDGDSALVDLLGHPGESKGVWAAAAPSTRNLAADTTFATVWNHHYHGDTCPNPPAKSRVTVGGRPGVLLAYNCGILVNHVVTVDRGVEYWFVFVDRGVVAATDRTDRATFLHILRSVRFR